MTQPTDIDPSVLAQSVFGLLMRSGRPRSEGLGRTIEVEHESGEAMTFTMLASKSFRPRGFPPLSPRLALHGHAEPAARLDDLPRGDKLGERLLVSIADICAASLIWVNAVGTYTCVSSDPPKFRRLECCSLRQSGLPGPVRHFHRQHLLFCLVGLLRHGQRAL
jgi:hypothetical protein